MTDLITELEFTTLSRLKQLPELPEEDHDGHDRVQSAQLSRASSRHNLKDVHRLPDGQTISKDSPTTATREIIQAPPPFPADLDLDGASRRHVQALIHQNIENVGLKDRGWETHFYALFEAISGLLTTEAVDKVQQSRLAFAKGRSQRIQDGASGDDIKATLSGKDKVNEMGERAPETTSRDYKDRSTSVEDLAGSLARRSYSAVSLDAPQTGTADCAVPEEQNSLSDPSRHTSKLSRFTICVSEDVGGTRALTFEPNILDGAPLFQDDEETCEVPDKFGEKGSENSDNIEHIGGTIRLRGPEREWNRIEKILTLMIYAICHLKLEVHLLRNSLCERPPTPVEKDEERPQQIIQLRGEDGADDSLASERQSNHDLQDIAEDSSMSTSPPETTTSPDSTYSKAPHSRRWSRANLVSLIFGRNPESGKKLKKTFSGKLKMHRTRSITRQSSEYVRSKLNIGQESLALPGSTPRSDWDMVAPEQSLVVDMARQEEAQLERATGAETPDSQLAMADGTLARAPSEQNDGVTASPNERFRRVIERMDKAILSVSPDVKFPPPTLLLQLREQEKKAAFATSDPVRIPGRPLLGRVKSFNTINSSAMSSDSAAFDAFPTAASPNFTGSPSMPSGVCTPANVKKISVDNRTGLESLMTGNNSLDGTIRHQAISVLYERGLDNAKPSQGLCQAPKWITIYYYNLFDGKSLAGLNEGFDATVYDFIEFLLSDRDDPCSSPRCERPLKDHLQTFIHDSSKVSFSTRESIYGPTDPELVYHWYICSQCGKRTDPQACSPVSLAVSLAKYLELLLYSAQFSPPQDRLCSHAAQKDSLVRVFYRNGAEIHARQENVDLFELQMPTMVDSHVQSNMEHDEPSRNNIHADSEALLTDIEAFFDSIDGAINGVLGRLKDAEGVSAETTDVECIREELGSLRRDAHQHRKLLEGMLAEEPERVVVNRARHQFVRDLRCCKQQFLSILESNASIAFRSSDGNLELLAAIKEPEYASNKAIHVLPVANDVLIREDEISSLMQVAPVSGAAFMNIPQADMLLRPISAFALNSPELQKYALGSSTSREAAISSPHPSQEVAVAMSLPPSRQSSRSSSRAPTPDLKSRSELCDTASTPDRSSEGDWQISVKTKKPPKPQGTLLSIKSPASRRRLQDAFSPPLDSRKVSSSAASISSSKSLGTAESKIVEEDDQVLEDLLTNTKSPLSTTSYSGTLSSRSAPALPALISGLTSRRVRAEASTLSTASGVTALSAGTSLDIHVKGHRPGSVLSVSTVDSNFSDSTVTSQDRTATIKHNKGPVVESPVVLDTPEQKRGGSTFSSLSGFIGRSLRLPSGELASPASIDKDVEAPHVKLTLQHGSTKMSVTVYHAEQFAALRKACGLPDSLYIDALRRCHALNFSGGKTNAGFLLTNDGRFVLKQMRTSWNVSEVDAMLAFAPHYCRYLLTSDKPSLLTKIFGVYTCKIKDLVTGDVKQKVDLVLMEHLFFEQEVTRKFDLKGISSRVAKTKEDGQTLWDADWVESVQTRLLIHAHHKSILRKAISADTEFLAQNNVMDYSALVGVDDKNRTVTVGLIDIIGTFNLAKLVESRSKQVLQQGERTVIPPDEYAARFRTAMEGYFVASPEKFSKPNDDIQGLVPALHCPL